MKINAYIMARGGSKRLPGKNLLQINSKSLLAHAIGHAKAIAENVYVSTDNLQIGDEGSRCGAEIIMRPTELSQGESGSEWKAWQHAVKNSRECDIFVSVPTVCPLRETDDIRKTIAALQIFDACVTTTNLIFHPFGAPSERSQDREPLKNVCAVAYAAQPSYVLRAGSLWDGTVTGVSVPKERALDIDDIHDFRVAKLLMESVA